eukprot:g7730.t1
MNLDIKSIQDKLRELNDAANEVKNSKVKMPEQIKLIATKATEYTPILQKLIDTVSTIPANDGDIRNTIKLAENKIKDTRAILVDISNLQKLPSKVGTIVNSMERFLSLAEGGTKVIQACLGVTDIFQNSTLEWDTLVSGIDKLNACKSGIESITFGDPKQQGQQQGGFLQNIEAKLNTIKNKVLELTEPFFKLINVVPVCTNAAKTLNSKDLKKCAKAIKEMPIFKEKGKGKNIKTAVSASIKIMADCKDIFDLDFDLNSLLQTVKELQKEFKTCLNTVDKEMKALGKFGEAVRKKVKKIQDFKTKIENMGAMAIVSAISNCNEMITNKNALKNAVEELPSLETEIEAGKDIYTWVESTHKLVDELIQTGKGNAEEITGLFKNLQSSAKKCFDSISAVTDLIPEKWQIRSRLENLGTKWKGHLKLSSKALISNSWWTKTKSWGKRLARGAVKVIRAATKVASKVFRLAGVLLEPLTQCIATLSEDDEETYKSAWRNCFEAACKQFDDSMVNAAAAFAGATAATPLCAKVALATSAIPVVGTAGGGSICLISAGAIAAEAADRAYQNSNIDEAADKACEGYLDIQVSDVTDELIDKVDKVMEMVSCPRLLDQQREENDLGECRRKDGAGSWWTCDTSNDCEPDPDNPCRVKKILLYDKVLKNLKADVEKFRDMVQDICFHQIILSQGFETIFNRSDNNEDIQEHHQRSVKLANTVRGKFETSLRKKVLDLISKHLEKNKAQLQEALSWYKDVNSKLLDEKNNLSEVDQRLIQVEMNTAARKITTALKSRHEKRFASLRTIFTNFQYIQKHWFVASGRALIDESTLDSSKGNDGVSASSSVENLI